MSVTSQNDGRKWINAAVAIASILVGYIILVFFEQLGEWFELEAKVPYFVYLVQGMAITFGLITFLVISLRKDSSSFLKDVYGEISKVVWPDKNETSRHTVWIIILVTVVGFLLWLFDLASSFGLSLLA